MKAIFLSKNVSLIALSHKIMSFPANEVARMGSEAHCNITPNDTKADPVNKCHSLAAETKSWIPAEHQVVKVSTLGESKK